MATPYVYERQVEYWTSRQIEEFFLDAGFEVLVFPLTPYREPLIPADFIFFDKQRSKLFAFQYKALYHNEVDFWPIDPKQHHKLADFPWIYYCLSELKSTRDHRAALHLARIVKANFKFRERVYLNRENGLIYSRWGAFYQGLERCTHGIPVSSLEQFRNLLNPFEYLEPPLELSRLMVDIFIVDFESRHSVRFSSQLRDVEG